MKKRVMLVVLGVLALAGVWAVARRQRDAAEAATHERWLMGTRWAITVSPSAGSADAVTAAFDEVDRIEALMSEWREDSPISAVNRSAGGPPVPVPEELARLVQRALLVSQRSDGAFDITWKGIGPLWDFRAESFEPPSDATIEAAKSRVDYRRVVQAPGRLGLEAAGMALGLGGIAKGYAVDRAAAILRGRGLNSFCIDGGGDVLVWGSREGGRPWRVGIRHPRKGPNELLAVVETDRGAVVTSGDYERFREVDGVRYHHIIDPRTGRPARGCQSVTIVAPQAEVADALATAVFVLGPKAGLKLVEGSPGVEALVVDAEGIVKRTAGFPATLR